MAFKTQEKEIGEYTFQVNTLPYKVSQKVLFKAKDLLAIKIGDSGAFGDQASPLSAAVFMDMNEDDLDFVIAKLAEYSKVKQPGGEWLGLDRQQEVVFAGNIDLMFKWLDFALEHNFASFLGGLKSAANEQLDKAAQAAPRSRKK